MADRHPLQAGDVAPDLSDYNFSNEADRRDQNYHGYRPAADQARAESGRLWKVGQAMPNLSAPFNVIRMDGDNNGQPTEVREIDMDAYGDCYDPTAPLKVRTVPNYHLDSDHDGFLN